MALPDLSGASRPRSGIVDLVGRVLAGRYRLVAPVGVGASAQVYLADDVQLRRRVAVKVLHPGLAGDPTFLRRFQAEAQAAAALNHPNVVAVYDWGRDDAAGGMGDAVPFLVTEYLEGGSLRAMLDGGDGTRGSQPLSLSQTLVVGLQVCRGLHYAHSRGFVHRDIKPANLLFGEDRRLRIADFGLARALAEASWTEPEGVVLGTARYVSPEQAAGTATDTRSDIYSLALVLVECVTGVVPHTADTAVATLAARAGRDVVVDAERFGPLAPLIESAGRADPADRCSAAQLGAALMQAAESLAAPAQLPLAPPRVFEPSPDAEPATVHFDGRPVVVADPPPQIIAGAAEHPPGGHPPGGERAHPYDAPATAFSAAAAPDAASNTGRSPWARSSAPDAGPPASGAALVDAAAEAGPTNLASVRRARRGARHRRSRRPRLRTMFVSLLVLSALLVLGVLGYRLLGDRVAGPEMFPVADYIGRDASQVQRDLEAAGYGWTVLVTGERRDGVAVDEIVAQTPAEGGSLAEGEVLELVRSLGNTLVTVPAVKGKPFEDVAVQRAFADASLLVSRTDQFDETAPVGQILSVAGAGREVEKFSRVQVVVSKGPEPRTLKDYSNPVQDAAAVQAELTAAGLVVELVEEASEEVEQGKVIRTEPPAAAVVPKGAPVKVVVSSGPPLLVVPDVYGMSGREAEDLLTAQGWVVKSIIGSSSGTVIATDPEVGIERVKGSPISIITRTN